MHNKRYVAPSAKSRYSTGEAEIASCKMRRASFDGVEMVIRGLNVLRLRIPTLILAQLHCQQNLVRPCNMLTHPKLFATLLQPTRSILVRGTEAVPFSK